MSEPTDAHDYHHGSQDASAQLASYHAFNRLTKWGSIGLGALILMLSLWFCVGVGFLGGLIPGVVVMTVAIIFLRAKPEDS